MFIPVTHMIKRKTLDQREQPIIQKMVIKSYLLLCVQDEVAYFSLPFSFDLLYVCGVDQTEGWAENLWQNFYTFTFL